MNVAVHITGIANQQEADALGERLQQLESVEVQRTDPTRIELSYDDEVISANDVQGVVEGGGGVEVITLDPTD